MYYNYYNVTSTIIFNFNVLYALIGIGCTSPHYSDPLLHTLICDIASVFMGGGGGVI